MVAKKPVYRQLNVKQYEFNQIQSYTEQALNETVRYIDSQATKICIIGITSTYTFNTSSGQQNDYLRFNRVITDINRTYSAPSGVFTAPQAGNFLVNVNFVLTASGAGSFGVFAQVNKSAITPQTSQGTNYDFNIWRGSLAGAGSVQASGSVYVPMVTNNTLLLYLYSSVASPSINATTDAQVSITWR